MNNYSLFMDRIKSIKIQYIKSKNIFMENKK